MEEKQQLQYKPVKKKADRGIEVITAVIFIIFLVPFFLLVINSFKSVDEIVTNPLGLNGILENGFSNYINIFSSEKNNVLTALITSVLITIVSVGVVIIFSAMAAWILVRSKKWWSKLIFTIFVGSMVIPFQVIMFPLLETLVQFTNITGLPTLGSIGILPVTYLAFQSALTIFMYHGFMKSIPLELEEAAMMDGCSKFQVFRLIILPILKPITVTVMLLNGIWIWNDYLLPFMMLQGSKIQTLPITINQLASQSYGVNFAVLLPAAVITILPVVVIFILAQKHIIKGMVEGSVK